LMNEKNIFHFAEGHGHDDHNLRQTEQLELIRPSPLV
jgi:hypothetical protein